MANNSKLKYFTRLEIENLRCFGTKQWLDLSDGNGNPTRWNIILGENGVGKTTLLEFLGWMLPEPANDDAVLIRRNDSEDGPRYERLGSIKKSRNGDSGDGQNENEAEIIILVPSLQNVDDNTFFDNLPKSKELDLQLNAEVSQERKLVGSEYDIDDSKEESEEFGERKMTIITGIHASYSHSDPKRGELDVLDPEGNIKFNNRDEIETDYSPPFVVIYGANRHTENERDAKTNLKDPITDRLINCELYDVEEILIQLHHLASMNGTKDDEDSQFNKFKNVISQILPGIKSDGIYVVPCKPTKDSSKLLCVEFDTFTGRVPLSALSLGYQTTLAWTLDLAWRLYEKNPDSDNPLHEPAIVLIDELDLHLHPEWQLRIMDDLSRVFFNVQFIATTHSPLLVQSKPGANFAVVKKCESEVKIENEPEAVKGWRVDQILNSEYFGLRVSRTPETEKLFQRRDQLLLKVVRSEEEEIEFQRLQKEVSSLRTESDSNEDRAIDLIQRAADLLRL